MSVRGAKPCLSTTMDVNVGFNKLYQWLHAANSDTIAIGGSATPALSLREIVGLSTDAQATQAAFQFHDIKFALGSSQGSPQLRETIVALYDHELSHLSPQDVIVANGTTGANHIVHQSLLSPGDHIICHYPIYGPCIEEPEHIGCDISYLHLDPGNNWALDVKQLESLIRPGKTKLLVINNPVNPTGTHFTTSLQKDIVELCKKHDIIIHSDEIFRPLFHGTDVPTSIVEHHALDYDNVVVTSSLSKAWGLSGVRIGWITTKSASLRKRFMSYRVMSLTSVSSIDEAIATEVLSPRCRPGILAKHLSIAEKNIGLIQGFVDAHSDVCDWVPPVAGAVGFIRFKDSRTGMLVDDVDFCRRLFETKNVLLAPGSICFEYGELKNAFKGRVRIHFTTTTENLQKGLDSLDEFLIEEKV